MQTRGKVIAVGRTVYPNGREIEVQSAHEEWTDFAARAVEAHDALVEALQAMVRHVRFLIDYHNIQGECPGDGRHSVSTGTDCMYCIARAALALAKGSAS